MRRRAFLAALLAPIALWRRTQPASLDAALRFMVEDVHTPSEFPGVVRVFDFRIGDTPIDERSPDLEVRR